MITKKKIIRLDPKAGKEFYKFSVLVQRQFEGLFRALEFNGRLEFPEGKKLDKNLYEIRVSFQGQYRGFYAYIKKEYVIVLHLFRKKTQKTPLKNLKLSEKRLRKYE